MIKSPFGRQKSNTPMPPPPAQPPTKIVGATGSRQAPPPPMRKTTAAPRQELEEQVEEEPLPAMDTAGEERLSYLANEYSETYAKAFGERNFPPTSDVQQANLLFAIFGELRTLNEQHAEMIQLLQSMKGE